MTIYIERHVKLLYRRRTNGSVYCMELLVLIETPTFVSRDRKHFDDAGIRDLTISRT